MQNEQNGSNLMQENWVKLEEIAEHLAVSKDTVRAWIKKVPFLLTVQENYTNLKFLR